ncbi:sulfatase-like hydrolase/transferase [Marinospirillum perlucidum]|uniref:sulfatase-like hydrolase/transferase n=1 Tax=Marinospirillum perlucidum TaxID=1982602 RepID=UPI000DF1BA58|nr:sulfatase-like hydrolase/transferase [Marinospirillum perlucidum]
MLTGKQSLQIWLKTAAVLVAVNFPFFFLASYLAVPRPWLNLDYALLLVIFALGYRWVGIILTGLFVSLDLLAIFVQVFPFIRVTDAWYLLQMFFLTSASYQWYTVFLGLFLIASWWLVVRLQKYAKRLPALVILNLLLIIYLFLQLSGFNDERNHRNVDPDMFVQSQSEYFVATRFSGFAQMFEGEIDPFKAYSGKSLSRLMSFNEPSTDKILFIIAESWGVPKNPQIQEALLQPLLDLPAVKFEHGNFLFTGATVAAEFRELCGLQLQHFNLKDLDRDYTACLPRQLAQRNFSSLAMHAATSNVYDRYAWYPQVGFDSTLFYEDKEWERQCYSFPGACDPDMLPEAFSYLNLPGRRFVYWLTLNSHATYDARDLFIERFDCSAFNIPSGESCRNLKLQAQFFALLAQELQTTGLEGLQIAIVGDHEPRIMNLEEKNTIFILSRVPWVFFALP